MSKILLNWTYFFDLIECPKFIANNINFYQSEFDKWISDHNTHHKYWVFNDEGELSLSFDSNAFVEWLNNFIIKDGKSKCFLVKESFIPSKKELELPKINF